MAMSIDSALNDTFSDADIDALYLLALGDFQLVEDALLLSLKHKRERWWHFKKKWLIDKQDVIDYIQKKKKEQLDIQIQGDGDEYK